MASPEDVRYYLQKYLNGELALSQIAERLNMEEDNLRDTFNQLAGLSERRQTLNG
jgi:AraC-like DNA-binding protein